MKVRRARRFVGLACLVLVAGCTALSGLGDLEIVDTSEAGIQNGVDGASTNRDGTVQPGTSSGGTSSSGDTGASSGQPDTGSSGQADTGSSGQADTGGQDVNVADTSKPDTGGLIDSGAVPDANQPDTGGPGTGPGGPGVVQCSAQLACSGSTGTCCFNAFFPFPTCTKAESQCPIGEGFACDDDSDCAGSTSICCVTWTPSTFEAQSKCAASCTSSNGVGTEKKGRACADSSRCDLTTTCKAVPSAPAPIRACQ